MKKGTKLDTVFMGIFIGRKQKMMLEKLAEVSLMSQSALIRQAIDTLFKPK